MYSFGEFWIVFFVSVRVFNFGKWIFFFYISWMLFGWFELDCEFGFLVFCVLGIFYELLKVYKVDNDGVLGVYWVGDIVYRWYIF